MDAPKLRRFQENGQKWGFMKNNKAIVVISWIMSVGAILCAMLISVGGMSKNVIVTLGIAVGWLIIGIINWEKGGKKER